MTDRTRVRAGARAIAGLLASTLLVASQVANASETLSYSYDALGRLVKVARSGTVNNSASECYAYDKAGNRSNVTVATSGDCSASPCAGVTFTIAGGGPVTEGGSSVFTITKNGATNASCSITFATVDGTATAPADYGSGSGMMTFTPSQTPQSITATVQTVDDTLVESAETFSMVLSAPSGGATFASPSSATATINDNDTNATCNGVSFSVSDASADEGGSLAFTVTKTGSTSISCSVSYATANGSALAGSLRDYIAASGTLTFSSAQNSLTVLVTTNTDSLVESDETMFLNLSSPSTGATITDSQGLGTIFDATGGGCDPRTC